MIHKPTVEVLSESFNGIMWQMILIIIICFLPGYFCSEKYCKLVGLEPGLRGKTFIVQVFARPQ